MLTVRCAALWQAVHPAAHANPPGAAPLLLLLLLSSPCLHGDQVMCSRGRRMEPLGTLYQHKSLIQVKPGKTRSGNVTANPTDPSPFFPLCLRQQVSPAATRSSSSSTRTT